MARGVWPGLIPPWGDKMGYVQPDHRGSELASVNWLEPTGGRVGLLLGTLVETTQGWRRVEDLMVGTRVYTYDGGLRPVVRLRRMTVRSQGNVVVRIPGGVANVCQDLFVQAQQYLMVGPDGGFDFSHGQGRLCQAKHLCGLREIGLARYSRGKALVSLTFAEEELIYANTGALVHCSGLLSEGTTTNYFPVMRDAVFEESPGLSQSTSLDEPACVE